MGQVPVGPDHASCAGIQNDPGQNYTGGVRDHGPVTWLRNRAAHAIHFTCSVPRIDGWMLQM